ncbi:Uncharacterised protein [Vibrio cholerae]|uniref:Uncharacterized protein n=1 Tax=Vibrio cholerae TaxID=666 RepID=A0A655V5P4_VIBCL|nr:Uncharacterised protein [Vibrio cholerae]CSD21558.1 Uncharacterised protein [Vibrio cholerae]CSD29080.1 Uncharacterised protein [Vibrio cholerae]
MQNPTPVASSTLLSPLVGLLTMLKRLSTAASSWKNIDRGCTNLIAFRSPKYTPAKAAQFGQCLVKLIAN